MSYKTPAGFTGKGLDLPASSSGPAFTPPHPYKQRSCSECAAFTTRSTKRPDFGHCVRRSPDAVEGYPITKAEHWCCEFLEGGA